MATTTDSEVHTFRGAKKIFSHSTVSIFGALASEIHTKSQCHTLDPQTVLKSCPSSQRGRALLSGRPARYHAHANAIMYAREDEAIFAWEIYSPNVADVVDINAMHGVTQLLKNARGSGVWH